MNTSTKQTIFFFHGLNTFGDDLLHLGPVTLGRMDQHLKTEMEKRGFNFVSINAIGRGSPEAQADTAMKQIEESFAEIFLQDGPTTFHLLGQSMGGLVARVVAHRLKERRPDLHLKLWTLGTPHRGSLAADFALEFGHKNRQLAQILRLIGYRVGKNSETFRHTTPKSLEDFNRRYPIHAAAEENCFLCTIPATAVSPYFLGLYGFIHGHSPLETFRDLLMSRNTYKPSDGFIPVGSQNWGVPHGPYELDHFAQMGFFSRLGGSQRRQKAASEFTKLCDDLARLATPRTDVETRAVKVSVGQVLQT